MKTKTQTQTTTKHHATADEVTWVNRFADRDVAWKSELFAEHDDFDQYELNGDRMLGAVLPQENLDTCGELFVAIATKKTASWMDDNPIFGPEIIVRNVHDRETICGFGAGSGGSEIEEILANLGDGEALSPWQIKELFGFDGPISGLVDYLLEQIESLDKPKSRKK